MLKIKISRQEYSALRWYITDKYDLSHDGYYIMDNGKQAINNQAGEDWLVEHGFIEFKNYRLDARGHEIKDIYLVVKCDEDKLEEAVDMLYNKDVYPADALYVHRGHRTRKVLYGIKGRKAIWEV